jgi:hypothetical protein
LKSNFKDEYRYKYRKYIEKQKLKGEVADSDSNSEYEINSTLSDEDFNQSNPIKITEKI